jgi:hypothetical protein
MARRNIWKWVLTGLGLLVITLILTWVLLDFTRRLVVVPVSYVSWLAKNIISSTHQVFFWVALLLLVGVLIGKSFRGRYIPPSEASPPESRTPKNSRLSFWLIQLYYRDETSQGRFADFLDRLVLDILTYAYRLPVRSIEQRLKTGEIEIPPSVVDFFQKRQSHDRNQNAIQKIWRQLILYFRELFPQKTASNPDAARDVELESILSYIEEQLEIHHDNSHL